MKKFFIGVVAVVTVGALVLVGCPDDSGNGGNGGGETTYDFVCDNGVASTGTSSTEGVSRCASCTTPPHIGSMETQVR